jgi:hypothetical protein
MKGVMFMFGELCFIYNACEIASEFEIEVSRPCVVGRQRSSRTSSDYRRISLCFVFLDHLVEEISKRVVSNEECFFLGGVRSYLSPANLQT